MWWHGGGLQRSALAREEQKLTARDGGEDRTAAFHDCANLDCLKLLVKPQPQSLGIAEEKHFSIFRLNSIATPVYLSSAAAEYCYI